MKGRAYRATPVNAVKWDEIAQRKDGLGITLGVFVAAQGASAPTTGTPWSKNVIAITSRIRSRTRSRSPGTLAHDYDYDYDYE